MVLGALSRWLTSGPRHEVDATLFWHVARGYCGIVHGLRFEGRERLPRTESGGPAIVVSNHTAGIDPILIQAGTPVVIRWLMAGDMRHPAGEWLWTWARIIFVSEKDASGVREAMRYLKRGGLLGVFPEGGIERPPRTIRPFMSGVGLIIHRTRAPVIPVIIDGTPYAETAWGSLARRGHARVRVMAPISYAESGLSPDEIAEDLRRRYIEWTGWPAGEEISKSAKQQSNK